MVASLVWPFRCVPAICSCGRRRPAFGSVCAVDALVDGDFLFVFFPERKEAGWKAGIGIREALLAFGVGVDTDHDEAQLQTSLGCSLR